MKRLPGSALFGLKIQGSIEMSSSLVLESPSQFAEEGQGLSH